MCQLCNLVAIANRRTQPDSQPQTLSSWGSLALQSTSSLAVKTPTASSSAAASVGLPTHSLAA
ncbi:MAG: hypothetical protein ACTS2F_27310 [Thainema sp.]